MLIPKLDNHEVFNTACGDQTSLNEMIKILQDISGNYIEPKYGPERAGDVKHSKASIEKIEKFISYKPEIKFREGLEIVFNWYKNQNEKIFEECP